MLHLLRKPFKNKSLFAIIVFTILSLLLFGSDLRVKHFLSNMVVSSLIYPFEKTSNFFDTLKDRRIENLLLKRQVTELSLRVEMLREAKEENDRLRELLDFQRKNSYPLALATVISKSPNSLPGEILISGGVNKNFIKGLPVVTPDGVAGRIEMVYKNNSLVRLLDSPALAISGRSKRSRNSGIVKFTDGKYIMDNVLSTDDIQRGDTIITSGLSRNFPSGIPIGVVTTSENIPGQLFKSIRITPFARVNNIEELFVLLVYSQVGDTLILGRPDTTLANSISLDSLQLHRRRERY